MAISSSPERELEALRDTDESEGEAAGPLGPRGRSGPSGAGSASLRSLEAEMAESESGVTSKAVGNLETPGPTLRSASTTARGSVFTPVPEALHHATSSRAESDQSSPAGRELCQQASLQAPCDDDGGDGGPNPRGSGTPEGWVLRSRVVPLGHRRSASDVSPEEVSPEAQSTGWNLRPRSRSSALGVSPEARPRAQSAGWNLPPRPRSSASVVSPEARPEAQSAGWNLRPRPCPRPRPWSVSPEARPKAQSTGWNLRPRATPRVPVAPSSTTRSSSDRGSRRATLSRSRSRSAPRLRTDLRPNHKIKMRLELESEPEPESEPELQSEAEQEEQELEPQVSRSSSRFAVPRRSSLATEGSPPRRPVRMRASSPSPPGRLYPLSKLYNEGYFSTLSSSSESSSHSLLNSTNQGSSPPLSSLSGPGPNSSWPALIPHLDNLNSSSSKVPGEEIEAAPPTREEK
ncbi:EZH inhibitory protein isoform X2 [Mus pahari]|uniref:EZH inhibitory protein isoform X2 n=1 Tax=Mus pahari TaxID=10093 RepID=UPI000A30430F|nr:EZH inhibitory protein isoform X2 [Mus pahari]